MKMIPKILVTGSAGFLGQNLKRMFEEKNIEVIEFDYKTDKTHDIRNIASFEQVVIENKPDICIHLAAVANLNHYDDDLKKGEDINIKGSLGIIDICEKYNIRLIFASTCCCYGDNKLKISNEESVVVPTEPYSQSKRKIELEIIKRNKQGQNIIICRLATFYGSKLCRRALATSLFIEKIYNDEPIEIHGNGNQHRTYTHVYDMCTGFLAIVNGIITKKNMYEIYNISRSIPISVMTIIKTASKYLNKTPVIKNVLDRSSQFDQLIIENKKLRELGWVPKYSFDEGMKELVHSFLNINPKNKWVL